MANLRLREITGRSNRAGHPCRTPSEEGMMTGITEAERERGNDGEVQKKTSCD